MDSVPLKTCSKCGVAKPQTTQFFHRRNSSRIGWKPRCKKCRKRDYWDKREERVAQKRERYARDRDMLNARRRENYDPEQNARHCRQWYENHKKQAKAYRQAYYAENRERIVARTREYRRKNPDRERRWSAAYRERHPERRAATKRRYNEANPDIVQAWSARRRAAAASAQGAFTTADILAKVVLQGGRCYYCHAAVDDYHVDHKIPLSAGGTNWPANLAITCPACNLAKGARPFHEFLKEVRCS